jgi:fluoride exporter
MSVAAWIAIGLLGGVAAAARFVLDHEVSLRSRGDFPLGILAVNLLGALAIGVVAGSTLDGEAATIVSGGVIGSFTTFSTWVLDSHRLALAHRANLAWLNIGLSVVAGFAAVALGQWLGGAF